MHLERRVRIFSDGFDGDAAHLLQRPTTQHRARAAEEGGVPQIVAVLNQPIEQVAFVGHAAERAEIALERIGRKEMMRGSEHRALRIAQEPAHGGRQKRAHRDVIAIEDGDEVALG